MSRKNIEIISAGAGSGKTYTLTHRMLEAIEDNIRISGIVATTFTHKAAAELQERVRSLLLQKKKFQEADELSEAMIGTVHSIGVKLLQRFAFEAGVSPEVSVLAPDDAQSLFNSAFSCVLTEEKINRIDQLATRLGKNKNQDFDWRKDVRKITEIARSNDFNAVVLEKSKIRSFESFAAFLPEESKVSQKDLLQQLQLFIHETIELLSNNGDATKITADAISELKKTSNDIELHQQLEWFQWARLSKLNTGVKSRDLLVPLQEIVASHEGLAEFRKDIRDYIYAIFESAIDAMLEFQEYKKRRGLIDYTDMEVLVKQLLKKQIVKDTLEKELDLLMVDEFQDTNPLQLDNFLNLSFLAKKSIWVGDPKQSIYGFRGADPVLMQAIISEIGIKDENILKISYRSRKDLVNAVNAIFTSAFKDIPNELIALKSQEIEETPGLGLALNHWHFRTNDGTKSNNKAWFQHCIANTVARKLEEGIWVQAENVANGLRKARPGDFAILCKTNQECLDMASALSLAGLKVAISRNGLLETSEVQLVVACLKFVLQYSDALSVAEILVLAANLPIEEVISDRLYYVENIGDGYDEHIWSQENEYIRKINLIREKSKEFSASEMLNYLIEELDLRGVVMTWGNANQRLDNIDMLRKLALDYEEACNRQHTAASLGGFILWINELAFNKLDIQAAGEGPDAVNVLTYHKSKGLEWPIVVCHALEAELLEDIWGMRIIAEDTQVDLNHLLEKRWLQFWVNPYADISAGTPLICRLKESELQKTVKEAARNEEIRLLYVGMTRASQYLIFPTRQKPPKWLSRVCMDDPGVEVLDPESAWTKWEWSGKLIPICSEIFELPREIEGGVTAADSFTYFEQKEGRKIHDLFAIDSERVESFNANLYTAKQITKLKRPFLENDDNNEYASLNMIAEYARSLGPLKEHLIQKVMLERLLNKWELPLKESSILIEYFSEFEHFLIKQYGVKTQIKNYPLSVLENKRKFSTNIDLLAETDTGMLIVKHETYAGEKEAEKAQSFSNWAFWVKKAVGKNQPTAGDIKVLIHFISSGNIFELV
ncbi:MAG: UvrD-helicase domain-containing protein [Saprospiraceae bacterium]